MRIKHSIYLLIFLLFYWPLISRADIGIELLGGSSINKGAIIVGSQTIPADVTSERTIIKNMGTEPITLQLNILNSPAGWTPVESLPGAEQYRLSGVFHEWNKSVSLSDFGIEDAILSSKKTASSNVFSIDNDDKKYKAYNIQPGTEMNLVYRFDAPTTTSQTNQLSNIRILITAILYTPPPPEEVTKPTQVLVTPNGDGINDTLRFPGLKDSLGVLKANLKIRIMNSIGKVIREITDKDEWDGKDDSNKIVKSGVYMYQYEADGKFICGLVVIAK